MEDKEKTPGAHQLSGPKKMIQNLLCTWYNTCDKFWNLINDYRQKGKLCAIMKANSHPL